MPSDIMVTVEATVRIIEDGDHYTSKRTEQRTYRFNPQSYEELRKATSSTVGAVDVVNVFLSNRGGIHSNKYSHPDKKGWAIEIGPGVVMTEADDHTIDVVGVAGQVYRLVCDSIDNPTDNPEAVYESLRNLAFSGRTCESFVDAYVAFVTDNLGFEYGEIEDWNVEETLFGHKQ